MVTFTIKFVIGNGMKGPVLAQKRVDSNCVLVIFNREIGRSPIYILNISKHTIRIYPFWSQNGTLHPNCNIYVNMRVCVCVLQSFFSRVRGPQKDQKTKWDACTHPRDWNPWKDEKGSWFVHGILGTLYMMKSNCRSLNMLQIPFANPRFCLTGDKNERPLFFLGDHICVFFFFLFVKNCWHLGARRVLDFFRR